MAIDGDSTAPDPTGVSLDVAWALERFGEGALWAAGGFAQLAERDAAPGRTWQAGREAELRALVPAASASALGPRAAATEGATTDEDAARAWSKHHERLVEWLGGALGALRLAAVGAGDAERGAAGSAAPFRSAGVALLASCDALSWLLEQHLQHAPEPVPAGLELELEFAVLEARRAEALALGQELRPAAPGPRAHGVTPLGRAPGGEAPAQT